MIEFYVLGRPAPAGSKRAFALKKGGEYTGRVVVSDANPKSKSWQSLVRDAAREAMRDQPGLMRGPLQLVVTFRFLRPKSHYTSLGALAKGAPTHMITMPDTTKLLRGLEDAMTGIVWHDDNQVVVQHARKEYGDVQGAEVDVMFLETPAFFQAQEAA